MAVIEEAAVDEAVSSDAIRATAAVTSDVHALLSTLLLRSFIWPACTAVPRAPAAPSPTPNID